MYWAPLPQRLFVWTKGNSVFSRSRRFMRLSLDSADLFHQFGQCGHGLQIRAIGRRFPIVNIEDKKQHKTFLKEEDKKRGKPTTNPNKTTAVRGCTVPDV